MRDEVTILIAHVQGTFDVLETCIASLQRHDAGFPFNVRVLADGNFGGSASEEAHNAVQGLSWAQWYSMDIGEPTRGSPMHGKLLDAGMRGVDTDFVLTLDSDCFPIADGWLASLVSDVKNGNELAGIAWPWIPLKGEAGEANEIERRVRGYHNWTNTQVACQLVRTGFVNVYNLKYASGDDTGFALLDKAHELGRGISAWMPTRCALPNNSKFDTEMNRLSCVVFKDKIFHMGGAARKVQGADVDRDGLFDEVRARVVKEKGAEWILNDSESYKYVLDREEQVVRYKMVCMYEQMAAYLETHECLFDAVKP